MKKSKILLWCLLVAGFIVIATLGDVYASEAKKPITNIMISAGRTGDQWYVLSQAMANFINKKSDWLRATVVATPGLTGSWELAMDKPKEYFIAFNFPQVIYIPKINPNIKREQVEQFRTIGALGSSTFTWVTYDENIKSPRDLVGKTVNVGRPGATRTPEEIAVLKEWGVFDKVKLIHTGFGGGIRNLKDGLADVAVMLFDHIYPRTFDKGAMLANLETRKPVHYISMDPGMIQKMKKERGVVIVPVRVPPKALDKKTQPDTLWAGAWPPFFAASNKMDPDVVYEFTRVLYESGGEFGKWHPQGKHMTKELIPMYQLDMKWVHPSAKKYYDDNGIRMKDIEDVLK